MTATFYVGDAIQVMATLPAKSVDLILSSPPFLALRSYLPADHPQKSLEGGSQATPGAYIDWLVDVVEACDRVLAPHGSLCIELGDTYAGSGGGGGDYLEGGWREGQAQFAGSAASMKESNAAHWRQKNTVKEAWPLPKSLSLIPELFRYTLVYGQNPLTGRTTERWRLRNVIRWVRPNPPVGALGDKFRPATSELMVFCKSARRFFDLDAVREPWQAGSHSGTGGAKAAGVGIGRTEDDAARWQRNLAVKRETSGAPPLDWWNIPLLDGEEETRYGPSGPKPRPEGQASGKGPKTLDPEADAGWAWERTLTNHPLGAPPLDWWNIPPGGYVTLPERVNPGEYVGGTLYIASEGCPLHAGRLDPAATAPHGEPTDTPSSHSSDTDASHVLGQRAGSAPTDQPTAPTLWDGSSDSPNPESTPAASRRNKASNKKAPAPATTTPDSAFDKTPGRTDGIPTEPLSVEPHRGNRGSKIAEDDPVFPYLESYARTGHKPVELEACTCSFYVANVDSTSHYAVKPGKARNRQSEPAMGRGGNWNTFPNYESTHPGGAPPLDWWEIPPGGYQGSHYAVWPPELCVKPIKAMSPEKVCRHCGEPSRRISEAGSTDLIGSIIRQAREAVGMSQKDVAAWFPSATGGVTGCVWNWENGANVPMAEQWDRLKEGLGIGDEYDFLIPDRESVTYAHVSDHPSGNTQNAKGDVYQRLPARKDRISPDRFSDCGHKQYRPGTVLDPFAGSGTTLAVATGHGRDAIGIDLDERNYDLALERVGPLILQRGDIDALDVGPDPTSSAVEGAA